MDGALQARLTLLKSLSSSLEKEDALDIHRCHAIVDAVVKQQLLLEAPLVDGGNASVVEATSTAIGRWMALLPKLLSSDKPSTRCAGALLLSSTAATCGPDRLLQHYAEWGGALVAAARKEGGGQEVAAAALAALAVLFGRLREHQDLQGVRKGTAGVATKVLQLLLPTIGAPGSPAPPAAALHLLSSLLLSIPTSLRPSTAQLEPRLADLVAGGAGSGSGSTAGSTPAWARRLAAHCLVLLPRAQGDAENFSATARRLLLSLHDALDAAFLGLDDQALAARARQALAAGTDAPGTAPAVAGLLGSSSGGGAEAAMAGRSLRGVLDTVGALMDALQTMFTAGFPVPVPLPVHPVLLLLTRITRMDDAAVVASGRVPPSASLFAELQAALPGLHCAAWRMLGAVLRACRSTLLPLQAATQRLLSEHLRRLRVGGPAALLAIPPPVRQALYATCIEAISVWGLTAAKSLAQEVLGACTAELYGFVQPLAAAKARGAGARGGYGGFAGGSSAGPKAKKAKLDAFAAAGSSKDDMLLPGLEAVASPLAVASPAAASVAAMASEQDLEAQVGAARLMAAILQAGGTLLPSELRSQYDAAVAHLAVVAADAARHVAQEVALGGRSGAGVKALQAAAYGALAASLAAPRDHRPPFLAQAVALFRQASSDPSAELRGVAWAALQALEGVLHPRATPMGLLGQYAGMDDVAPLAKPRMWNAIDGGLAALTAPKPQPPTAAATAAAPTVPAAATATAAPTAMDVDAAAPTTAPAAVPAPAAITPAATAAATPAATPAAAQAQAQAQAPALADAAAPAAGGKKRARGKKAAAAAAAAEVAAAPPAAAAAASASQQQQQQAASKPTPSGSKKQGPATASQPDAMKPQGAAAATAAGASASGPTAAGPSGGKAAAFAALRGDESSDSEGEMPGIDSGDDDDDDDE